MIFMANTIVLIGRRSFTLGLAMMFGISVIAFAVARYFDFWYDITKSGIGMYLKYIVVFGLVCLVVWDFMLLYGLQDAFVTFLKITVFWCAIAEIYCF